MKHVSFEIDNYPALWATCMFNANQELTRNLNNYWANRTRRATVAF